MPLAVTTPTTPSAPLAPPAEAPTPPPAPAAVAGFDAAGAALPDTQVWGKVLGNARRPLYTSNGIDGWERRQLLSVATKDPQAFLQRLMADSKNGTPVKYQFKKESSGGVIRIDFEANAGHVKTDASFEVFNKGVDGWLKPYLARNARDKGVRSKVTLQVEGDLNKEGGIDNVRLGAAVQNLPKFSADKLMKVSETKKEIAAALKGEGSQAEKSKKVLELVSGALKQASEIPLGLFIDMVQSSSVIELGIKEKKNHARAKAELGGGKWDVEVKDILGEREKGEADLRAKIGGGVAEDKDTISIGELKVFVNEPLSLSFDAEKKPQVTRTNSKGEKEPLNDHVGEALMYLPLVLALAGGEKIF